MRAPGPRHRQLRQRRPADRLGDAPLCFGAQLRSDYLWDPTGQQCHTFGLAQWVPITGNLLRASTHTAPGAAWAASSQFAGRRLCDRTGRLGRHGPCRRRVLGNRANLHGRFLPVGGYDLAANTAWMAWQAHRADLGEGLVQAFRRQTSRTRPRPIDSTASRPRHATPSPTATRGRPA